MDMTSHLVAADLRWAWFAVGVALALAIIGYQVLKRRATGRRDRR